MAVQVSVLGEPLEEMLYIAGNEIDRVSIIYEYVEDGKVSLKNVEYFMTFSLFKSNRTLIRIIVSVILLPAT